MNHLSWMIEFAHVLWDENAHWARCAVSRATTAGARRRHAMLPLTANILGSKLKVSSTSRHSEVLQLPRSCNCKSQLEASPDLGHTILSISNSKLVQNLNSLPQDESLALYITPDRMNMSRVHSLGT